MNKLIKIVIYDRMHAFKKKILLIINYIYSTRNNTIYGLEYSNRATCLQ